jgi:hypothetical protein
MFKLKPTLSSFFILITAYLNVPSLYLLIESLTNRFFLLVKSICRRMLQPSVHEGWSTCVEEAKTLGKLLILSDIGVHREHWPDNQFFFEPLNATSLVK